MNMMKLLILEKRTRFYDEKYGDYTYDDYKK